MPIIATKQGRNTGRTVQVLLTSARVTEGYRDAVFAAADARGLTPTDFLLIAAAGQLTRLGYSIPGIFRVGDLPDHSSKDQAA